MTLKEKLDKIAIDCHEELGMPLDGFRRILADIAQEDKISTEEMRNILSRLHPIKKRRIKPSPLCEAKNLMN
jgi:hypothetical protein